MIREKILHMHIDQRKNIFFGALVLIGLCSCMYIYLVTTTIRNIVAEKQFASQVSDLSQTISSKEFSLIHMQSEVTLQYARSLGFSEAKDKVFITPKSVSFVSSHSATDITEL